jgi:hypothetical protein
MANYLIVQSGRGEMLFRVSGRLPHDVQPVIDDLEAIDGISKAEAGDDCWLSIELRIGITPREEEHITEAIQLNLLNHHLGMKIANPNKR